jgi:hypothetical protein
MRIDELTMGGMTPSPETGMHPAPRPGAPTQGAQTGMSPQQQMAQAQKEKMQRKKDINDQIAELMKQMAELRKQLSDVQ